MIKPVGALCNLDCHYCYYLPTKTIFPRQHRMSLATLESIFASVLPRFGSEVTVAWQGGEPTLAGLDFFQKAIDFQNRYARPGQRISHALQTNGTLLDDDWCKFLNKNEFLIGLSLDGPPAFHDRYRLTNRGSPSAATVLRGLKLLQTNNVQYNILCVLNDHNVGHPDEVFGYLVNLGSRWLQFIPAIEWVKDPADSSRNVLAPYSPDPEQYGRFLCRIFDLWFERHRATISVRDFDAVLNKLVLGQTPFCILDGSCHTQLTIEHDGSVFGCDHFIERRWQLAQIGKASWKNDLPIDSQANPGLTIHGQGYQKLDHGRDIDTQADLPVGQDAEAGIDADWFDRVQATRLAGFAARKQRLPERCKACRYKPFCHGGCPKHRQAGGELPEPTILCRSYMMFFDHAMERLQWLAGFLRRGQQPPPPDPTPVKLRNKKQTRDVVGAEAGNPPHPAQSPAAFPPAPNRARETMRQGSRRR